VSDARGTGDSGASFGTQIGQKEVFLVVGNAAHRKGSAEVLVPSTPRLVDIQYIPGHGESHASRISD
jgi:hypothetical protein